MDPPAVSVSVPSSGVPSDALPASAIIGTPQLYAAPCANAAPLGAIAAGGVYDRLIDAPAPGGGAVVNSLKILTQTLWNKPKLVDGVGQFPCYVAGYKGSQQAM